MDFNITLFLCFKEYAVRSLEILIHDVWVDTIHIVFYYHSVVAMCWVLHSGTGLRIPIQYLPGIAAL